jgi:hypothetical protein
VRAYSESSEEALRSRDILKDWADERFINPEQYRQMQEETVCDLRRTNIFLRLVLFLFTLIIVGAAVALFFILLDSSSDQAMGVFLMIFAVPCSVAAEIAVGRFRLYRYGIEEALLACSVGFLCAGMQLAFFDYSSQPNRMSFLVPVVGAVLSGWIWHRFGLPYASLAAMLFVVWLPGYWTSSPLAQHLIIAALYAAGLATIVTFRPRHRFTYLDDRYSLAEALLWLGIYAAINLQLSSLDLKVAIRLHDISDFSRPFYWTTWILTWCLPPIVLARGVRLKDKAVIVVGLLVAILTLVTNRLYLGWPQHTWDPMLLGALLIGVALFVRRWLANGPGGIRHGLTAQRLSGKDKSWINAGAATIGFLAPNQIASSLQAERSEVHFDGGKSGGGGATSDF